MFDKMKQLMEMQKKAKEMQKLLDSVKVEKASRDGKIRIVLNGNNHVEEIGIDESLFTPSEKASVEKTLRQLLNDAGEEARQKSAGQAMDMMKNMNIKLPGF